LFRLLALLPLYGIEIQSVATPLLNTGRQQATPDQLYPSLIRAITTGFRHIPDMKRLVIFDHKLEEMETLHEVINSQLRRSSVQRRVLTLDEQKQLQLSQLRSELRAFQQATDDLEINLKSLVSCMNSMAKTSRSSPWGSVPDVWLNAWFKTNSIRVDPA
jgi:hypothetical protein